MIVIYNSGNSIGNGDKDSGIDSSDKARKEEPVLALLLDLLLQT